MAVLEQVMQMKQQGYSESQIIQLLKEYGISPKEINEALSQSKIKSAVAFESEMPLNTPIVETEYPTTMPTESSGQMQPSMIATESSDILPFQNSPPTPQSYPSQETQIYPQQYTQEYPQETMQYPSQEYSEQDYYDNRQPADIETINEIAEQIAEEKIQKIKKELSSLTKLKQELEPEIQSISKRLEKVEDTINELQIAILKKIGEYGQDIKNISDGLSATQESFSKMINPVLDHKRGKEDKPKEHKTESKTHKRKKSAPNFESYLR